MGFELDWRKDFGLDWECHCREGWLGYGTRRGSWVWYKEGQLGMVHRGSWVWYRVWYMEGRLEYGIRVVRIWVLYTLFIYVQHVTRL